MQEIERGPAQRIAAWLIRDGTDNTMGGSWLTGFEQAAKQFCISEEAVRDISADVLDLVCSDEAVADAEINGDAFDIVFFLGYCKNLDTEDLECPALGQ